MDFCLRKENIVVLGFAYSDKIEDIYPIKFDFDKENKKVHAYYIESIDLIIAKNEIVFTLGNDMLFVYDNGMIAGLITDIDYDNKRIKVGDFYLEITHVIYIIGIR